MINSIEDMDAFVNRVLAESHEALVGVLCPAVDCDVTNIQKRKEISPLLEKQAMGDKSRRLDGNSNSTVLRKISPKAKLQGGIAKAPEY